jgi:uncharacterized surface protein with fasciclin (FAS1) repeats
MKIINRLCLILLLLTACGKEDSPAPGTGKDGSTINYVLNDNFSFGVLYATLDGARLLDTLSGTGPYTVLAPDNNAFKLIGISYPVNGSHEYLGTQYRQAMRYAILPGRIAVSNISLNTTQVYKSIGGGNVYVKKYEDGTDTIVTVNGFRFISTDNPASNGLIQVVPQLLNPELYATTAAELRSDTTTTMFAAAMLRAGLTDLLSGSEEYTVLVPSNTAFFQAGYTLEDILHADAAELAALLQYHIIKGRYFEGDLFLNASDGITMLNGENVIINGNPAGFKTITFLGNGNSGISAGISAPGGYFPASNNANIPCGNGVVHIINRVLIP